jgi:hypothetical protein
LPGRKPFRSPRKRHTLNGGESARQGNRRPDRCCRSRSLEVVAYRAYQHNSTDGQTVLVYPAIVILAAVAISFVYAGDQAVKQYRERRRERFANRNAKPS